MVLVAHPGVETVGVFTTRIASLSRPDGVRCQPNAKIGTSGGQSHSMGCVLTTVRRSIRGTLQGGRHFQVRLVSHVVVLRQELAVFLTISLTNMFPALTINVLFAS